MKPLVQLVDINVHYSPREPVLSALSLALQPGRITAIIGPSGIGKSTLLKVIAGIQNYTSGTRELHPSLATRCHPISWMPQDDVLLPWRSLLGNIHLPREICSCAEGASLEEILTACSLFSLQNRSIEALSGGQKKMVVFARMMLENRSILLLDEPFVHIDAITRRTCIAHVKKMVHGREKTCCFVTHDFRDAVDLADEVYLLSQGVLSHHWVIGDEPSQKAESIDEMFRVIEEGGGALWR